MAARPVFSDDIPSFSLVLPVFNEEERLGENVEAVAEFLTRFGAASELIIVDDGSTDGTVAFAREFSARAPVPTRVIAREHEGKGAAVRAGLEAAGAEFAGFCDADLSTPLSDLERVLQAAVISPVLAIGSRGLSTSELVRRQSPMREWLGKAYNRVVQLSVAPGISDTQCGAKVAAASVWKKILPWTREVGFSWDVEAVAVARRLGIVVREVAIRWHHDDRSRVRVGRDGAKMLLALARVVTAVNHIPEEARELGAGSGVFDRAQANTLVEFDSNHWWFRSKAAYVSSLLRDQLSDPERDRWLVDVGAGAGGVTAALGWKAHRLIALEASPELARRTRERHALMGIAGEGERLPFASGSVGVVTLLDVIEHLQAPEDVLCEVQRILRHDGLLVVSVPAHDWLWSRADELLGHVRRYNRHLLRQQLEANGLEPVWASHLFSWLVLPAWCQRRLATDDEGQLGLNRTSLLLDRAALVLTRVEWVVAARVSLPLGSSIMCAARKATSQVAR